MSAVQPGYKMTEVGVIPEDWGVEELGTEVCTVQLRTITAICNIWIYLSITTDSHI